MWSEEKIQEYLKENLSEHRFQHSIGVRDYAIKLAQIYNLDVDKARLAGLTHDCAKHFSDDDILKLIESELGYIDEDYLANPQMLHGRAGSIIAKNVFGICDEEVLNAIAYHTTGRKHMTDFEKIIYLSDYIEVGRCFKEADSIREEANKDLNKAVLMAFDNSINHIINKKMVLYMDTVLARNDILIKINKEWNSYDRNNSN